MQRLTGYGLRLASQLAVPGAMPEAGDAAPDVMIVREPPTSTQAGPVYALMPDGLQFMCAGVATYRIGTDTIAVAPDPDAAPGAVSGMLVATALPALLWLRGRFVLHAAAAQLAGGDAVAIAGGTGSGKSTVLAQLVDAGAALLGDDTIAFDPATARYASGWPAAGSSGTRRERGGSWLRIRSVRWQPRRSAQFLCSTRRSPREAVSFA